MNATQRFEFQAIREDQDRLHHLMQGLDWRIDVLARNLIPVSEPAKVETVEIKAEREPERPPPLPPPEAVVNAAAKVEVEPAPLPRHTPVLPLLPEPERSNDEPLELRVGTYWMSRLGIVILLTGLVFLGNYAYHLIVPALGPLGKVSLLLMAGLGLGGAGYWLERSKESLRNFGRVLCAGGAATIYYTTYAAHFVQGLRVIESPLIGGVFLLAVAGGIAWYAERKRSETIASLAVFLSYYTSAINSIAGFTLFSSLLLTGVAVYFLVRNNWTRLSSLSLFATYGSYAFWRFHQIEQLGASTQAGMGLGFLTGYWLLFTAAVFLAKPATLRPAERISFLTLNNAAFFCFAAHHFAVYLRGGFWMFSLGFGGVLLGLAALAAYLDPEESTVDGAYLAQGLIAITVGFVSKFSGPQLSMILALESAALLSCIRRRHGLLYEIGAYICSLGSFALALDTIRFGGSIIWSLGAPAAALFLFNAWWIKYLRGELDRLMTGRALVFATLGLVLAGCVVWHVTPDPWKPSAFAILPVLGLAAFRIRLSEVGFGTQFFIPFGSLFVVARLLDDVPSLWFESAPVVASAILFVHWWQSRRADGWQEASNAVQLLLAMMATGVSVLWLRDVFQGDAWLTAVSVAAIGAVAYGLLTRAWAVAFTGQIFSLAAIGSFILAINDGHPGWGAALMPVLAMTGISVLVFRWAGNRWPEIPRPVSYAEIAWCYRIAGSVLFAIWSFEYVPPSWRVVFFAIGGALQIVAGSILQSRERVVSGILYAAAGITLFWARWTLPVMWPDLFALLAIPLSMRVGAHLAGDALLPKDLRNAFVTMVLFSVWFWVTRWTMDRGVLSQLTISWTILALVVFAAGLALRERVYRLGGFAILTLALGRLFIFDVWKFDSLYRIISFIVLGAALLALSFVYHRFAETLRKVL